MENFQKNLKKYADLIVEMGVNVTTGHTVVLQISTEQTELAHLIVEKAYEKGAAEVLVQWSDDFLTKQKLLHADEDRLTEIPEYVTKQADYWLEKGASRISVVSSNPNNLAGVDGKRIGASQKAMGKAMMKVRQATQANKVSWIVVAAASPAWAKLVFPDLPENEQVPALWEEIFKTTRVTEEDPIAAWVDHEATLVSKAKILNDYQFDALHYTAPGTDLTIGLPKNHLWEAAGSINARGEKFIANMPTEEVFTAPDSRRIDGVVSSTKPLSYGGNTLLNMKFTFKDGKVVDYSAEQGQEVLKELLAIDEGAKSLGEVALVPDPSPISQSGITFYNTLFDENASNHLALGSAYAFNIQGGTEMSEEELIAAGLNRSHTHVDFMIGSSEMNIDGITKDGKVVPIFRNGDWA